MATPPDFVAGQVLTAAQMNKIGLWLVKTQTIGTAVSSIAVTNAFSADYENYLVLVNGGVSSTGLGLNMTLGATTTGYYYAFHGWTFANTASESGVANTTSWAAAFIGSTLTLTGHINVYSPFLAKTTYVHGQNVFADTSTGNIRQYGGFLNNTTSYTDFTLTTSTGTVTGGTIYVYGYRD